MSYKPMFKPWSSEKLFKNITSKDLTLSMDERHKYFNLMKHHLQSESDAQRLFLELQRFNYSKDMKAFLDAWSIEESNLDRSGDLEQNSGKIRAIPSLLVQSHYSQNGLSTSP